ncbi:MAG: hypothetical protein ACRENS_05235 [Candidatus Eiseniibacteriota bacterium]
MRRRFELLAAVWIVVAMLAAPAAHADLTVIGHYKMANGDTLTRASYFTGRRVRTMLPNGVEIVYNHSARRVALIDHAGRRYWEGPLEQADSIASRIRAERMRAVAESITPETQGQVNEIYAALGDSVRVVKTDRTRKIAGYSCSEWVLTAGPYLRQERWVARAMSVPDFSSEVEKVVLASALDPMGAGLMNLVLKARSMDGLGLAGTLTFKTMRQSGVMSWEAQRVLTSKIPDSAWSMPEGYQRWTPPAAGEAK